MHKAGPGQHRIFGLEKIKKKLDYRPILSVGLTTFAVLDSISLSFSLHLHGMGTILTSISKENNSCEICLNSKSSQECANSLF